MEDPVPSILEQGVPVVPLKSAFHAYNSGTADLKRFCSRSYDRDQKRSRLIWQRRVGNYLRADEPLDIPGTGSFEDGRVFAHAGRNYVSFTEGFYERTPYLSVQQVAALGPDWQVEEKITIAYGRNGRLSEKNWQFFSHEERLYFIYSIVPHLVVSLDNNLRMPLIEYRSDAILNWPWGEVLRGGTPPIRWGDSYLTFFHSHVAHRHQNRRYVMGAYLFEAKAPFAIRAISPALLRASQNDEVVANPSVPGWNPLVIFPTGAVQEGSKVFVVCGVNDSFDVIAEFEPDKIEWHPPSFYSQPGVRFFEADNGPLPILHRGQCIHWKLRKITPPAGSPKGYLASSDPNIIALIENRKDTKEIDQRTYNQYEAGL